MQNRLLSRVFAALVAQHEYRKELAMYARTVQQNRRKAVF